MSGSSRAWGYHTRGVLPERLGPLKLGKGLGDSLPKFHLHKEQDTLDISSNMVAPDIWLASCKNLPSCLAPQAALLGGHHVPQTVNRARDTRTRQQRACRLDLAGRKQEQEAQKARKAAEAAAGHHAQQRSLQLAQRLIHKRLAQIFRYLAGVDSGLLQMGMMLAVPAAPGNSGAWEWDLVRGVGCSCHRAASAVCPCLVASPLGPVPEQTVRVLGPRAQRKLQAACNPSVRSSHSRLKQPQPQPPFPCNMYKCRIMPLLAPCAGHTLAE